MNKIMLDIHQSIINIENPIALMALMSVPVVGTIVKLVRDLDLADQWLADENKWVPSNSVKIELINKMNDNTAYAMIGFSVQAIAFFILSAINPLFAISGGFCLVTVAFLAWDISKKNEIKKRISGELRQEFSIQFHRLYEQLINFKVN